MRAVIFTDLPVHTSVALSKATISTARNRPNFEVCGFVTANPAMIVRSRPAGMRGVLRRLVVWGTGGPSALGTDTNVARLAHREGLPMLMADEGVNGESFIQRLHHDLAPDVILSYYCMQILRQALLDSVDQAVNYHDGLLPHYRGLAATSHSIYAGETRSGHTFHRMTTGIDDGPILRQDSVPVGEEDHIRSISRAKVSAAVRAVPAVIDMIEANRPGVEQTGDGSYFNRDDYWRLSTVDHPGSLSSNEVRRRIRAFNTVTISIGDSTEAVTGVASARPGGRFAFPTADGHLRATRISGIPSGLVAARRRLRTLTGR